MADTTFVNGITTIDAAWLNDINDMFYTLFASATTAAQARAAIGAGTGNGDFLADGTVPMTGSLSMGANPIIFEGSTADGFETTVNVVDPTADRTINYPNASGTLLLDGDIGVTVQGYDADTAKTDISNVWTANQTLGAGISLVFEGTTDDTNEGTLSSADVTADRTWTLPDKSGTVAMTSDITSGGITVATVQATTSGTAFDFTGIPAGTKRVVVMGSGVSLSGSDSFLVQIGDSGGIETSGYVSSTGINGGAATLTSTSGFVIYTITNASAWIWKMTIDLFESSSNTWIADVSSHDGSARIVTGTGSKSLSATLDRVRVTRTGTDTFDAGSVTIAYES